jgi:hypothetical protein
MIGLRCIGRKLKSVRLVFGKHGHAHGHSATNFDTGGDGRIVGVMGSYNFEALGVYGRGLREYPVCRPTMEDTFMAVPALYWRSLQMSSPAIESDADIWNVTKQSMKEVGLLDVKKNASDVNGHTQNAIVAVTFVKLAVKNYMLIIMAAGTNAIGLRDQVYNKLKNVHWL